MRWLRPEYQIPRFGKGVAAAQEGRTAELDLPEVAPVAVEAGLPAFPSDRDEHPLAVERALRAAGRPMTAVEIARGFSVAASASKGASPRCSARWCATAASPPPETASPPEPFSPVELAVLKAILPGAGLD